MTGPDDLGGVEAYGVGDHRVHRGLHDREIRAGIDQSPEQHVAGDPRGGVDPGVPAGSHGAAICAARWPAPYPLSMLTTATPGAQELSMVSRAASPSNAAP